MFEFFFVMFRQVCTQISCINSGLIILLSDIKLNQVPTYLTVPMNHAKIGFRYKVLTTSFIQRHNIIYFNPNEKKLNLRIFQIWILCIIPIFLTLLWKKQGGPLDAVVDWKINKLMLVQKTNRRKEQNHLYSRLSSHQLNPCCLQVRYLLPIAKEKECIYFI